MCNRFDDVRQRLWCSRNLHLQLSLEVASSPWQWKMLRCPNYLHEIRGWLARPVRYDASKPPRGKSRGNFPKFKYMEWRRDVRNNQFWEFAGVSE